MFLAERAGAYYDAELLERTRLLVICASKGISDEFASKVLSKVEISGRVPARRDLVLDLMVERFGGLRGLQVEHEGAPAVTDHYEPLPVQVRGDLVLAELAVPEGSGDLVAVGCGPLDIARFHRLAHLHGTELGLRDGDVHDRTFDGHRVPVEGCNGILDVQYGDQEDSERGDDEDDDDGDRHLDPGDDDRGDHRHHDPEADEAVP